MKIFTKAFFLTLALSSASHANSLKVCQISQGDVPTVKISNSIANVAINATPWINEGSNKNGTNAIFVNLVDRCKKEITTNYFLTFNDGIPKLIDACALSDQQIAAIGAKACAADVFDKFPEDVIRCNDAMSLMFSNL
jgi:hypothetical protein